ncbi:MAG: winged helix-turn-helix transcriptional regulator [Chloroflexi bacterium]|nr:winged helix-turn-helix transcriptional regulator [Chloroflexota bacterium]
MKATARTPRERLEQRLSQLMDRMVLSMRPPVTHVPLLMELTMPQLRTLLLLFGLGPLRMGDLASTLSVALPTATSLMTKLEEKGLATRQHTSLDRRVVLCSLTEQGRREAEKIWRIRLEHLDMLTSALDERELELVVQAMELLGCALERSRLAPEAPGSTPAQS